MYKKVPGFPKTLDQYHLTVCPKCNDDLIDFDYDEEEKIKRKECPACEVEFIKKGKGAHKVWRIKSIYDI